MTLSSCSKKSLRIGLYALAAVTIPTVLTLGFLWWQQERATRQDLLRYPPPGKRYTLANGATLHLYCVGQGEPTVVLEAGLGNWSIHYSRMLTRLANDSFTTCAYDRPGYGWSDPVAGPLTPERVTDDLWGLLHEARYAPPYVMVGHSLGGLYARHFTARHPEAVTGLLLIDPAHPDQLERLGPEYHAFMKGLAETFKRFAIFSLFGFTRSYIPTIPTFYLPEKLQPLNAAFMVHPRFYSTWLQEADAWQALGDAVRVTPSLGDRPLIVISAGKTFDDFGLPLEKVRQEWWKLHEEITALSTRGTHEMVPEGSHLLMTSDPDRMVGVLRRLVAATRTPTVASPEAAPSP